MTDTINILLIEDNPGDARLVQEVLHESSNPKIKLFIADSLARGKKLIAAEHIHVILLDLNLPDSQGLATFKQIRQFALYVPIIIMSILSDKELIFEAMKEGAQDYLIKGTLKIDTIIRAIRYAHWSYNTIR